jgi:hypothetical protein
MTLLLTEILRTVFIRVNPRLTFLVAAKVRDVFSVAKIIRVLREIRG